jgi:hypothetical protein
MRTEVVIIAVALTVVGQFARAQPLPLSMEAPLPPPITSADMPNYCVYENKIYSLGSGLCLGHAGYVCVPSPGPATGNRAFWTTKDDQVFPRPLCN